MTDDPTKIWASLSWDQIIVYLGLLFILLGIVAFLGYIIHDRSNDIEWWHFIATRGGDGRNYGDVDKLGKVVALTVSSVIVVWHGYALKMDAILLGVYLAYAGAIGGYSAYLRTKQANGKAKDTSDG